MKIFAFLLPGVLLFGEVKAQNGSVATACVSAAIIHPAIISIENRLIEGAVQKRTSSMQSSPFVWLNKRIASFYIEDGGSLFTINATTDNPLISKLEVVEGDYKTKGKQILIIPVFSGSQGSRKSLNNYEVTIHFN